MDEQIERALALKQMSRDIKLLLHEVRALRKDIGRPKAVTRADHLRTKPYVKCAGSNQPSLTGAGECQVCERVFTMSVSGYVPRHRESRK